MKRIIIFNDLAIGGGVENVMQNLVKYLATQNYEIIIFTDVFCRQFYDFYPTGVKYYYNLFPQNHFNKIVRKIYRGINKLCRLYIERKIAINEDDIVIAMKEGHCMKYVSKLPIARKFGWVHVDYNYYYWTQYVYSDPKEETSTMRAFDKIVCVSESTKNSIIQKIGDPGNLIVKYNPINAEFIQSKAKEPNRWVKPNDKMLFVSVGRLTEQKNYMMLLNVVNNIGFKDDYELWIVGDGPQKELLKDYIEKNNLYNVKLIGNQTNPYSIMKLADWVISSAKWESFGLVLQEARILGVPSIATSCPAIDEVYDRNCGILVDNNEIALGEILKQVIFNRNIHQDYCNKILCNPKNMWLNCLQEIEQLWKD